MNILGISAFYHDSAAALLVDGEIRCAAQEDRFSRRKHDARFPTHAVSFCMDELAKAGIGWDGLDYIAFYEKPILKFERIMESFAAYAPNGHRAFREHAGEWISEAFQSDLRIFEGMRALGAPSKLMERVRYSEHHLSHAAGAFYPSAFDEAVVLSIDGVGEWATTSVMIGKGADLTPIREIKFPHSLGLLYSAFTQYTGFKANSGEYKLMGLAPYGEPRFVDLIRENLIDLRDDGSFRMNLDYFDFVVGTSMISSHFEALFGQSRRLPEEALDSFHMDVAASIQVVLEQAVLNMARSLKREFGIPNLCLAGGVALNCVANGKILRERIFDRMWIQPAAGDAGSALGAAYVCHAAETKSLPPRSGTDRMRGAYLGPEFDAGEIEEQLLEAGAVFEILDDSDLIDRVADELAAGKAIGWHQGRGEFGPRALGNRSIIADPRGESVQKLLNLKVKYRESFRPFAPAVLAEDVSDWFELDCESPYMLFVADVQPKRRRSMTEAQQNLFGIDKLNIPRSDIPAVTHVDYSARVQTVHSGTNPRFHELLTAFKAKTGCPLLVNTSFNVRGEPIVNTPKEAFNCFMGTELDILVVSNYFSDKSKQESALARDYSNEFELD